MKLMALGTVVLMLLVASTKAQQPTDVSVVQLIANPEKFDGKLIRVIGFLRLEFEGNALYLHRDDYDHAIAKNGIWVDVTPAISQHTAKLNMNYVLLEGIFESGNRGHMGMFSGSIKQIRRSDVWPTAEEFNRIAKPPQ